RAAFTLAIMPTPLDVVKCANKETLGDASLSAIRYRGRRQQIGMDLNGIGAPGEIRTPDHLVRSQVLYPTELRARCGIPEALPPMQRSYYIGSAEFRRPSRHVPRCAGSQTTTARTIRCRDPFPPSCRMRACSLAGL